MFESGMDIVRADFHLHTNKDKEFTYSGEPNSFVTEYVEALFAHNIRVAVITNHNKFDVDEYRAIKKKAKKKDILVLPGVELSVKEGSNGVHTLIVFDPDTWIENGTDHISTFLSGAFAGISNYENENTKCKYDLGTAIGKLDSYGKDYFIIFAHAEQKSGILTECAGGLLESLVKQIPNFRDRVLGIQKIRTRDKIENIQNWLGYLPAFVEGSDPKQLADIGKGQASYIKIGAYTFSAVKFALQDADNRIFTEPPRMRHGYIESISFTGGKLDGETIHFSSALNTLIGIRGSGKSSILETLRYAFGIDPQNDADYKNDIVKNMIGSGGIVEVSVIDRNGQKFFVRRIHNQRPSVLDDNRQDLSISPNALFDNLLYFGQKDLSSSSNHEAELLNRIVGTNVPDISDILAETLQKIEDTVRELLNVESIPNQITDITAQINEIKHKIKIYKDKGVAEKLKKQTVFTDDLRLLQHLCDRLEKIFSQLTGCLSYSPDDFDVYQHESEYNSELIKKAQECVDSFLAQLSVVKDQCATLEEIIASLNSIIKTVQQNIDNLQEEFAAIKREIADDSDESLDPDTYIQLNQSLSELQERLKKLTESVEKKGEIENKLRQLIRLRNEQLSERFRGLLGEAQKINNAQSNLQIHMDFKGNRTSFKDKMKAIFKGTSISDLKYQKMSTVFSDFADIIADWLLNNGGELTKILAPSEYAKLIDKLKSNYENLIPLETEDEVNIYYHGKLLRKHSLGQRASALILFILTHDDTDVIIIDQPEDDLDNKVIYDEVLQTIRNKKDSMQFIFATHNANIPVLGDADMILAVDYSDDTFSYHSGNIDEPQSQQQIINIMEGGKEAFTRRKMIYSTWTIDDVN